MPRYDALPASLPPRGLSREAAAQYIGVSVGKFDEMIVDGRMPKPVRIDGRNVWDRRALDRAFDALVDPNNAENPWDELFRN
jgi:predicted DNA-binding transcriptional regulator AlpA